MSEEKESEMNKILHKMYGDLDAEKLRDMEKRAEEQGWLYLNEHAQTAEIVVIPRKVDVELVNKSDNPTPDYETDGASGFDLRADLRSNSIGSVTLGPLERFLVPTGLYFGLPENIEMQIRPRSGLAAKHGVTVLNTPGTIDSDYTGEVKIILVNLSNELFTINHGERIAQGVMAHSGGGNLFRFKQVQEISKKTQRGSGGFGSTGTK